MRPILIFRLFSFLIPSQAEFCSRYLPQFVVAFAGLPPATSPLRASVLEAFLSLWSSFGGHAHMTRYLIHHPQGEQAINHVLEALIGCGPAMIEVRRRHRLTQQTPLLGSH